MCQAIKKCFTFFVLLIVVFILYGCFLHPTMGPGYAVDIKVADTETLTTKDIKFLEDIVTTEEFSGKRVTSSDKWECIHFIKDVPQIQIGCCYDREQYLSDSIQGIKNLQLLVSNDWKGQEPAIKQEIDRLGEIFYKELTDRFGKENVKIERRRTGPPF